MAVRAFGVDMLQDKGKVLIALENIISHSIYNIPPTTNGFVRMEVLSGGFLIKPINEGLVHFSMLYNLQPHIYVPDWLLNWVMSFFASYVGDYLCKLASNVGKTPQCPYQKRINDKSDYYGYLRKREEEILH